MTKCNFKDCDKEAKGSWLDQNRLILTYACEKHFKENHLKPAKEVDELVKPEVMPFRKRMLPLSNKSHGTSNTMVGLINFNCKAGWNQSRKRFPERHSEWYYSCGCCKECVRMKGQHYCKQQDSKSKIQMVNKA